MIGILSREAPIGFFLLLISGLMAVDPALHAGAILFVHLTVAFMMLLMFRRSARQGNIIVVVQLAVLFLFSLFCAYVLTRLDAVAAEPTFDFSVFTAESVKRALILNDFGVSVMLLVYASQRKLQRPSNLLSSIGSAEFGRVASLPPNVFIAGLYFSWGAIIMSILLTPSVLQYPYPENYFQPWALAPMFRGILILIVFAFFLIRFVQDRFRTSPMGLVLRVTTYAALLGIGLLGGSRGSSVGLLIALVALDGTQTRGAVHWKWLFVTIDGVLAVFAVVNWPYMRYWISYIGFVPAFISSFGEYAFLSSAKTASTSIFLSDFPMLGQSLFHFLYAIALIDSGASLHYQTFLNLIPQQLPTFLDGILWTRPTNDNWLLADQFHQAGGFYSFANAYWNGGILPLGLFAGITAWVIARIEILFKDFPTYYGPAYFMLTLLIPVGYYYGIQGLVRGIEYGLIAYLATRFIEKLVTRSGGMYSKERHLQSPPNKGLVQ